MAPSNEFNLVLAFTKSNSEELRVFNNYKTIDWQVFFKLVVRHRLHHQVCKNIQNSSEVPDSVKVQFLNYSNKDKIKLLTKSAEIVRISRKFKDSQIKHWFVKGLPLTNLAYGVNESRPCKDIDIWVEPKDLHLAMGDLVTLGYTIMRPNYPLVGAKLDYLLAHPKDISAVHHGRQVEIELHFGVNSLWLNYFDFNQLKSQEIKVGNELIVTLQDDFHLLYLMIHGATHAWVRLRWLLDIVKYINTNRPNLNEVMRLASILKCEHVVWQTLNLAKQFFEFEIPDGLVKIDKKKETQVIILTRLASQFVFENYEFIGIWHKMFVKYRIYLLYLAVSKMRIKTFLNDFIKLDQIFLEFNLPDKYFKVYYLLYPFLIIKKLIKVRNFKSK